MTVKFRCKKCGMEEDVPKDIVDMLEQADHVGTVVLMSRVEK